MGYWWPPAPQVFDPVPRPLRWEGSKSSPIPSVEDCTIFGIGDGSIPGHVDTEGRPYASYTLVFGGTSPNKPGRIANFLRQGKTVGDRLDTYRRLIDLKTPEDPIRGGLCADTIDYSDGSIQINYWDFSDDTQPRRKRITYRPIGSEIKKIIEQWEGYWKPEGDDAEKGFIEALPSIIAGFGAITTIVIGYLTGNPALAGAWSNVFKMASSPVFGGPPPSLEGFAMAAGSVLGAAPDFGKTMGNLFTEKAFKSGIYGEIGKINFAALTEFGEDLSSHLDKLKATVSKFANQMPRIDLDLMSAFNLTSGTLDSYAILQGRSPSINLPSDVVRAVQNSLKGLSTFDLDSFGKAGFAFTLGLGDELYYSIRKAAIDKSTFEATFAAMLAMKDKPIDQRMFVTSALDPSATATVASTMASFKKSVTQASDASATMTFRQALAASQKNAPAVLPTTPAKDQTDYSGLAALVAFLYALSKVVR